MSASSILLFPSNTCQTSCLHACFSPQVAEAMAVLRGIRFAVDAGLVLAVIESDAKYVVDLIKLGDVAPSADVKIHINLEYTS